MVKLEIVKRQFAKVDETWCEIEDLRNRGLAVDRSWSSFCVLIPGDDLDALAASLRNRFSAQQIDVVPSTAAKGVWVMGAHYQLEVALARLKVPLPA